MNLADGLQTKKLFLKARIQIWLLPHSEIVMAHGAIRLWLKLVIRVQNTSF